MSTKWWSSDIKLPSGKKLVRTTHAEKYWGFYVFLFTVALNVGFFRLMGPSEGVLKFVYYILPVIANIAIYFLAFYIEALKQDPEEFWKPDLGDSDENHFMDGSRYVRTKPTHAQYARSMGDILAGPILAYGLGLAIAANWPNIRSWYYQL